MSAPLPQSLYPRERQGTYCIGGWVGPQGRSGRVRKISPHTGIRSPDRPSRSESLYRLSYPGRHKMRSTYIKELHPEILYCYEQLITYIQQRCVFPSCIAFPSVFCRCYLSQEFVISEDTEPLPCCLLSRKIKECRCPVCSLLLGVREVKFSYLRPETS